MQRTAGNRAVGSLVGAINVQREGIAGKRPKLDARPLISTIVEPLKNAVENLRSGNREEAGKYVRIAERSAFQLVPRVWSSDPDLGAELQYYWGRIRGFHNEIEPRKIDKIATDIDDDISRIEELGTEAE